MGPEIIAAVVGPVVAGMISVIVWQSKRNTETLQQSLTEVHKCVHQVEQKVDDLHLNVAANSVTREELARHVDMEEDWHAQHHTEVRELRDEMKEKANKMSHDIAEMKDMQWQMRLDQLDMDSKRR